MPLPTPARPRLYVLLAAFCIIPVVVFFAALPWLSEQSDDLVYLVSGIIAAVTIVGSFTISVLIDRRLDEWNRSNARFSSQWGWTTGACLVAMGLAVPALRDGIVSVMARLADVTSPDSKLIILTFTFGFMAVVFAQVICTVLLSIGWSIWKSRPAREA